MKKYIIAFLFFINTHSYSEIINKVEIVGNDRVSKETIMVYGDISLKSDYKSEDLNEILKKLYETNFFNDIKLSINNGILEIAVKEYPIINSIVVEGEPKDERVEQLLETIASKKNSPFIKSILSEDIETIKKIYLSLGFNFTKVDSRIEEMSKNRVNLFFFLDKGSRTEISKINWKIKLKFGY